MTRSPASFAAAMTAGLLMGGFAESHAATLSDTSTDATFSLTATGRGPAVPVFTGTTLAAFNPALGTLTEVVLSLSNPSLAGSATIMSGSEGGSTSLSAVFGLAGPGPSSFSATVATNVASCSVPSTVGCTQTVPGLSGSPSFAPTSYTFTAPDVAPFVGTTPLSFDATITSPDFLIHCNDGLATTECTANDSLTGSVALTVEYTYDPSTATVAEPGSLVLVGGFLLAWTGAGRMRRRERSGSCLQT